MSPLVLFLLMAVGLFILAFVLRVHSSALFIAVTGSYVMSQFINDNGGYINISSGDNMHLIQLGVFIAPILITLWLMRKSMPTAQFILQFLPHLGNSFMAFILVLPLLSTSVVNQLKTDPIARTFMNADDVIILFAVILQLVLMILTARPTHDHK